MTKVWTATALNANDADAMRCDGLYDWNNVDLHDLVGIFAVHVDADPSGAGFLDWRTATLAAVQQLWANEAREWDGEDGASLFTDAEWTQAEFVADARQVWELDGGEAGCVVFVCHDAS